ncbi:MAG: hypothetical protein HQK50_04900 [Oligoflexia bacterium]|nr:hypothetical protein [Oligoflexia bacterium]MBF0364885.1 hypothetical protein [Oligoflexia bacterium]
MKMKGSALVLLLALIAISFLAYSCIKKNSGGVRSVSRDSGNGNKNYWNSVDVGFGRVLHDNPRILSGNPDLQEGVDFSTFLTREQDFITTGTVLENSCSATVFEINYNYYQCFKVLQASDATPLLPVYGRWAFDPSSNEFLEVHTYYHVNKVVGKFQELLAELYTRGNPRGAANGGGGNYLTSIPPNLYSSKAYWLESELMVYSNCTTEESKNEYAYYDPVLNYLCLPKHPDFTTLYASQDPTVIYHEVQHAFASLLFNLRGRAAAMTSANAKLIMGLGGAHEGSALGEGLSDFVSYMMNQRTHIGEWGIGLLGASRPMSEEDPMHIPGISRDDDSRLSYPFYVNYDPNFPKEPGEVPHYSGSIVAHFLVALVDELTSICGIDRGKAINYVYQAIMEALVELGDVTAKGSSNMAAGDVDRVNMSSLLDARGAYLSAQWIRAINPLNYRRFFQTFAKYMNTYLSNASIIACTSSTYNQDKLEKLLDKYGLLLFRSYNDNGNGLSAGHSGTLTKVNSINRQRSVLISKDYISLTPESTKAYVFDVAENMGGIVSTLRSSGLITNVSPLIPGSLHYNNGNGKISPGEIVGILPVLKNSSNSIMAGVQVLANDWDHGRLSDWTPLPAAYPSGDSKAIYSGDLKICNTFEDKFPLESEGAANTINASATPVAGDCEYITRMNGVHKSCSLTQTNSAASDYCSLSNNEMNTAQMRQEMLMPVCVVQYRDVNETKWISQKAFRESVGFDQSKCLISDSPFDCFVRAIPGGDQALYSKINPNSTWAKSVVAEGSLPNFASWNLLLFEINPRVPPGTTFDCRLRARFTNCDDCWHDKSRSDGDDYLDYEYSGGNPYKIIHFQFTITD